jgi:crotonobetainyl-CoA:carnitine CoA-transferase CaiB-like acyl-CoA transferase
MRNLDELDRLVAAWSVNYTSYEVMEILQNAGVASTPCLDLMERFSDPQFEARNIHPQVEHPATGVDIIAGVPFKMSENPCDVRRHAPMLGQDNEYVFLELLSKLREYIDHLIEEKVIN